ncbi:Hint domain-containing protein [uncultured Litoreibacter sp.]|uniref:Hint domain-containing protein n=1 Tax=uncultured Litoreibacter sp. TaxID=1392394 RepID=UPI0026334CCA|nr:Hint domain-containing protein [uncultured Litoreibacter sp.]
MSGYISEYKYYGLSDEEFIEIAVPIGTDVSSYTVVIYQSDGTVVSTFSLGTLQTTIDGQDVYVIDNNTPGFDAMSDSGEIWADDGIALVDDTGTVLQFVSHWGNTVTATEGAAAGMTSTEVGTASGVGESLQSDDGGSSYYTQSTPNSGTIPCYALGTMIDTSDGPRAVETLQPGDLVVTLDHGPQPIRWTRSGEQPLEYAETDAKPVLIKAGALGRGWPTQDLIVSPQHRILVGGAGQLQRVFASEAFASAKSLIAVPGIRHMKGKKEINWIHFACDRHEVVTANGCLSESLLLGPMVVNGLSSAERQALTELFGPALAPDAALNGPPARECLTVGTAKRQIAKQLEENGALLAKEIRK